MAKRWGVRGRLFSAALVALIVGSVPVASAGEAVSVIVQGASAAAAAEAVGDAGGDVTRDLSIIDGVAAEVTADEAARLRGDGRVTNVSVDAPVQVQSTPSPLHAASAVYPAVVGADRLWKDSVTGSGIGVAVVDTGVAEVADLMGRVVGGIDLSGEGDPKLDSFGHGTFVAGIIAGNGAASNGAYKGVAPNAKIVPIKIAGADGASDVSHVLAGIQWAVSFRSTYNIRVLNLSLGTDSTQSYKYSPLNYAVEKAWDSGIVVTVSSSNNGPAAGTVTKPADDPLVITVGATDDKMTPGTGDDVMAGFSGAGPTVTDKLVKPDLVAPGRSVISLRSPGSSVDNAYPGSRVGDAYFKGSGTSFSTAVTSGSVALLLQREPGLTPNQVKARLMSTASPGPVGQPNVDGKGVVNAYAASYAATFTSANQNVTRSNGRGSLDADRGSLDVSILVPQEDCGLVGCLVGGVLDLVTGLLRIVLTGDLMATNEEFDDYEYRNTSWTGTRWYESQWSGTRWYDTEWEGTRWYGTRWYTTDWYGTRWYAIAWE